MSARPWENEPSHVEFQHAGLPCIIHRVRTGALCGYVAVPPTHPLHGKHYDIPDVLVHGGLTYADACSGAICHKPVEGEPDNVWWFGFDCAHAGDLVPGPLMPGEYGGTYRDIEYVTAEVKALAEQLAAEH